MIRPPQTKIRWFFQMASISFSIADIKGFGQRMFLSYSLLKNLEIGNWMKSKSGSITRGPKFASASNMLSVASNDVGLLKVNADTFVSILEIKSWLFNFRVPSPFRQYKCGFY